MSRVVQKTGLRGSLKWIQRAVNEHPDVLNAAIGLGEVEWLSPLGSDEYAEYRDGSFLERCGVKHLSSDLEAFWPQRGPQWDARSAEERQAKFCWLRPKRIWTRFARLGLLPEMPRAQSLCTSSTNCQGNWAPRRARLG